MADWIAAQVKEASFGGDVQLSESFQNLEKLHSKKLWHQLSCAVEDFIKLPNWSSGDFLIQFYQHFITSFQEKMKPLKLALVGITISKQFKDNESAVAFLNSLIDVVKYAPEAKILLQCAIGTLYLQDKEMKKVKQLLEECKESLDSLTGVEAVVNSSFYILSATYHKVNENAEAYYNDMLLYLSHIKPESLSQEEQASIAYDLGIAALVGESVYNFTELLSHPVFVSMEKTQNAWLVSMVRCFNVGDIDGYKKLLSENQAAFNNLDIFVRKQQFLIEKITILALMCTVFRYSSEQRTLSFSKVAEITKLPENEVELLLMKSLSLKLIKGIIDQVSKIVTITWVQPRALELSEIETMRGKLTEWQSKVQTMQTFMCGEAPELLSH